MFILENLKDVNKLKEYKNQLFLPKTIIPV